MTHVSDFIDHEAARTNAVKFLGHLTVEQLDARAAKLAELGKKTAAAIASGDLGEVVGSAVRGGRFVDSHANVAGLNIQRRAWAETVYVLNLKRAGTI